MLFFGGFQVHLRSANRMLKLCETNKGFYVKAGQFVAALRQVPKEYSSTLSSLQDQVCIYIYKYIFTHIYMNGYIYSCIFSIQLKYIDAGVLCTLIFWLMIV